MPFFCVWFGSVVAQIQLAFVAQGSIQLLRHKPHLTTSQPLASLSQASLTTITVVSLVGVSKTTVRSDGIRD